MVTIALKLNQKFLAVGIAYVVPLALLVSMSDSKYLRLHIRWVIRSSATKGNKNKEYISKQNSFTVKLICASCVVSSRNDYLLSKQNR